MTAMTAPAAALLRTSLVHSRLVRLLSDGVTADASGAVAAVQAKQSFAERLGLWLGWTDAIALAAALSEGQAQAPSGAARRTGMPGHAAFEACARVRKELAQLATADVVFTADKAGQPWPSTPTGSAAAGAADFAPHRRDYLAHQRAMDASIGPLRAQVRAALAEHSPSLGRLAALDAVLDEALRPRERQLLATVPQWLETHFVRLHQLQPEAQLAAQPAMQGTALVRYGQDMQSVLLAELDIRLQPVEGLLEALRNEITPLP